MYCLHVGDLHSPKNYNNALYFNQYANQLKPIRPPKPYRVAIPSVSTYIWLNTSSHVVFFSGTKSFLKKKNSKP